MHMEVTCIITARVAYIVLRHHRFIFNLGYGFDAFDPVRSQRINHYTARTRATHFSIGFDCQGDDGHINAYCKHGH